MHKLDKHYSDFGGLDTSTNLLTQDPKTAREGSKNFRWNYKDSLQKREGFQHKTDNVSACEIGLIEYKFKDINTGESKSEILGVASDGNLRKRYSHKLQITITPPCTIQYYSFYYDAVATTWRIFFLDSVKTVQNAINIPLTMTLDQLKTAINGLSVSGLSADVVDDDGAPVVSSLLAYLMDVKFEEEFLTSIVNSSLNPVYDWTLIPTPDGQPPFVNAIAYTARTAPFDTQEAFDSYEGISSVNTNTACYITDGGWVYKYDGRHVYRAGMPDLRKSTGLGVLASAHVGGWNLGTHVAKFQLRYKDINGIRVLGDITKSLDYNFTSSVGNNYTQTTVPRIAQEPKFPIYACKTTAGITVVTGSNIIDVVAGHNIQIGQCIRFEELLSGSISRAYYFLVTSLPSATQIEIDVPATASVYTPTLIAGQTLNGVYVPELYIGKRDESLAYGNSIAIDLYGPYYVMLATKANVDTNGVFYEAGTLSVPRLQSEEYVAEFGVPDVSLVIPYNSSTDAGSPLPRACKYLNIWQNQIVQAGRPYDSKNLSEAYYPTTYDPAGYLFFNNYTVEAEQTVRYTEVHLCDFQSVYWASFQYPEGFPQDGNNEESFENNFNDAISGIMPNKEALFCFKSRTTAYLTGTLATGDIVKEFLEADVGAACQNAIQEVRGTILFMDENMGFWSVVAGRLPEPIGFPISDTFKENSKRPNLSQFNFRKAKSTNFRFKDMYICYIPSGVQSDPGSSSITFVLDYAVIDKNKVRKAWYLWSEINAAGGVLATANDELLISQKQTGNNRLLQQKLTGSIYDFSDHQSPIEFDYRGSFLTLGAPVIDKNFIRCVINSVVGGFLLNVRQYGNFMDTVISDLIFTFPSTPRQTVKDEVKANVAKLSGISWGFYNNQIHEDVQIDGWEVEYSPSFDIGEAKK